MNLAFVVAVAKNGVIGRNGGLRPISSISRN
jgi:hypothetical protein